MAPTLEETPDSLVEHGRFNTGVFAGAFKRVNFEDAKLERGAGGGLFGGKRLIEFQHFALGNGRFHVSVALFDTKLVGQAQVSIYDRETRTKYRHERKALRRELHLPPTVWGGEATFRRGNFSIRFVNGLARGAHTLTFSCPPARGLPEVSGEFTCHESPSSARAVVCLPFPNGAAMYSHKGIIPAEGTLRMGAEEHPFPRGTSYAITDFHKGYYPRPLRWHWASGAGYDHQGRLYGFNLTRNQCINPERYNETWFFRQAAAVSPQVMERLPLAAFHLQDSNALQEPWQVRDEAGLVDIQFHPEVSHNIDMNLGILASRYRGPYGRFSGELTLAEGEHVDVGECFGMAEDFWLRG